MDRTRTSGPTLDEKADEQRLIDSLITTSRCSRQRRPALKLFPRLLASLTLLAILACTSTTSDTFPSEGASPTPELTSPASSPDPTLPLEPTPFDKDVSTPVPTNTATVTLLETPTPFPVPTPGVAAVPTLVPTPTSTPRPTPAPTFTPVPTLTPTTLPAPVSFFRRLDVLPDPFAINEMAAVCDPAAAATGDTLALSLNLRGQAPGRSWGSSAFYHIELSTLPIPTPTPPPPSTSTPMPSNGDVGGFQGFLFTVEGFNVVPGLYTSFPGDAIRGWGGGGDVSLSLALDPGETDWRFSDWRIAWQLCGEDELFFWGSSSETAFPETLRGGDLALELTVQAVGAWALWVLVPEDAG